MFTERTSVGLDVHARSVAAAAYRMASTGELVQASLTPSDEEIRRGGEVVCRARAAVA